MTTDTAIYPHEIYELTEAGEAQIRRGATRLPPEALSLLVFLDGKRTVGDVEQALKKLPPAAVRDSLRSLVSVGFVRVLATSPSPPSLPPGRKRARSARPRR